MGGALVTLAERTQMVALVVVVLLYLVLSFLHCSHRLLSCFRLVLLGLEQAYFAFAVDFYVHMYLYNIT